MFKRFILIASLTLIASGLFAADDYEARKELRDLRAGRVAFRVGEDGGVGVKTDAIVEETTATGVTIDGLLIKDGAIVPASAPVTTVGVGTISTGATSVVEQGDGVTHKTILTLTAIELTIANQAQVDSATMYTFPEGRILVEGVTASLVGVNTTNFNASTDDIFYMAVGTVAADAGDTLSSTEVDLIPLITNDTVSGTVIGFTNGTALAASAQFDGTTTAKAAILNMCIPQAADSGANTNTLTGTVTISWKSLGDY